MMVEEFQSSRDVYFVTMTYNSLTMVTGGSLRTFSSNSTTQSN